MYNISIYVNFTILFHVQSPTNQSKNPLKRILERCSRNGEPSGRDAEDSSKETHDLEPDNLSIFIVDYGDMHRMIKSARPDSAFYPVLLFQREM